MAIRVGNVIVASGGGVKGDTGENGANTVTDSTTNGNILVNGSEIVVYDDTNVKNSISDLSNNKVDKVTGKSLIADTEVTRLSGISSNATKTESSTTNGNIKINGTETKVFDDSSIQTALNGKVDDSQVLTNVPANAVFTDTITTINGKTGTISKADIVALGIPAQDTTYNNATTSVSGLLSNTDKTKLDGITAGATNVTLSTTNGNIKVNDTETTVYTHPSTHAPSIIAQDSNNRFVTDTQISTWNNKLDSNANAVSATKLANPRNINGVPFDGQSDITITDNTKLPTSYLDTTTTLGTSDVKVSTQNAVKSYVDNNMATIDSQLAEKAKQVDLLTQQGRIDNLVQTSSNSFYGKCLQTDTGALLVVSSGATTGQINLASVAPVATGYTPAVGDFVRLVYGVASGSSELIDIRTSDNGNIYDSAGNSVRNQFKLINNQFSITNLYALSNFYAGYFYLYSNGAKTATTDYEYSDLILCNASSIYVTNVGYQHICYYDASRAYIGGEANVQTFTTPSNCAYLRISRPINKFLTDANNPYFCKSDVTNKNINGTMPNIAILKHNIISPNEFTVDKSGNGDFTTVTDACASAPAGSIIYIKSGVYDNEEIRGTWSKKLYLIGESKQDTIIKNHTGKYLYEPIQIGSGLLENLTFYAYNDASVTYTNPWEYAIHIESDNLANDNLTIRNCIVKSDFASALGMGMRGGCSVVIEDCEFISPNHASLGFHDADNNTYIGVQNLSIRHCILYTQSFESCFSIQTQEKTGTTINLEMISNRLKSTGAKTYNTVFAATGVASTDSNDFLGVKNLRLKETSWGNSDATFNSQ